MRCPHCGFSFEPDEDEEEFEIKKLFPNMRRALENLKNHGND